MNRGIFSYVDWHLIIPVLILSILSLSTLLSISSALFQMQLIFFMFSLLVFLIFSYVNFDILGVYRLPIYILSCIVLIMVLILGIESRGAVRWVDIFGIRIQFSEILKPFLAISLSFFLGLRNKSMVTFLMTFFLTGVISLLIQKQPDLGNAIIYMAVVFLILLYYGFSIHWFGIGGLLLIISTPLLWHFLHDYQKKRILTFLYPFNDPLGTSYNAIQSMIAVGSGMIFGKGLGEGTQSGLRFLPERHTDFIFATLSEDFGFLGATVLILCFVYLFYRIYIIIEKTDNIYARLFCVCALFLFLVQFFLNVGMNIGLIPIVGVTLPFVSYGGSSMLSNFIFLGIISSISKSIRIRDILEIR